MRLLRACVWVILALLVTFSLGIGSSLTIKPILLAHGIQQHWVWPLICFCAVAVLKKLFRVKINLLSKTLRSSVTQLGIGATLGVFLQYMFLVTGLRGRAIQFHGILFLPLFYQVVTVFGEELLFRGVLQQYLANTISSPRGRFIDQTVACVIVSVPFGMIHGLNPILFGTGAFDWYWFFGTFSLSIFSGLTYAFTRTIVSAFGVHMAHNFISSFF